MMKKPTYRILVADDDAISRDLLQSVLLPHASKLLCVENGEEVLLAMAESDYDFVFMDVHMPVMDGLEATRAIRAAFPAKQTPVIIAITASSNSSQIQECLQSGMNDYVGKPIDNGTLRLVINKWSSFISNMSVCPEAYQDDSNLLNMKRIEELKELEQSSSTRAIVNNLINLFKVECPIQIADMKSAVESNDVKRATAISHRLRGSMLNLGLIAAASMCEELENATPTADRPSLLSLVDRLEELYDRSFKEFSMYLQTT